MNEKQKKWLDAVVKALKSAGFKPVQPAPGQLEQCVVLESGGQVALPPDAKIPMPPVKVMPIQPLSEKDKEFIDKARLTYKEADDERFGVMSFAE